MAQKKQGRGEDMVYVRFYMRDVVRKKIDKKRGKKTLSEYFRELIYADLNYYEETVKRGRPPKIRKS